MLKIRLRRVGRSKQPLYRVVVAEHTAPRDGRFVEIVGQYDPASKEKNLNLNEERIKYWISVGAQPTETVHRILFKQGLYDVDPPKRITVEKKPDEAPADEAPADEAPADEAPADEAPADEAPADEAPADEAPAEEAPADEAEEK